MKLLPFLLLISILSCKRQDVDIIGRNGKVFHNDTTDIIIRDYNNSDTLILEGIDLKNDNKPILAIHKFNLAEKKYGSRLSIYLNRGFCYDMVGKIGEAIEDYSKCLEMKDDYFPALLNRSMLYKEIGEREKALADINKAVAIHPMEPAAYYNRAIIYKSISLFEKACLDAKKSKELGIANQTIQEDLNQIIKVVCK